MGIFWQFLNYKWTTQLMFCDSSVLLFLGEKSWRVGQGDVLLWHFPFLLWIYNWSKNKIKIKNWDWLILDFPWTKFGVVLVTVFMQNSEKKTNWCCRGKPHWLPKIIWIYFLPPPGMDKTECWKLPGNQ